jgi:hypothetical protein
MVKIFQPNPQTIVTSLIPSNTTISTHQSRSKTIPPQKPHLFLRHRQRSKTRHCLQILLRRHLALPHHLAQHLEVIDIKRRTIRIDKLGLDIERIAERMRRPDRHRDEIARRSVDVIAAG